MLYIYNLILFFRIIMKATLKCNMQMKLFSEFTFYKTQGRNVLIGINLNRYKRCDINKYDEFPDPTTRQIWEILNKVSSLFFCHFLSASASIP